MRRHKLAVSRKVLAAAISLLLLAGGFSPAGGGLPQLAAQSSSSAFLPLVSGAPAWTDCSQSAMGSTLMTLPEFDDSTGPELARLAEDGYLGLTASPTRETALEYFPLLDGWDRVQICNSHDCLRSRAELAATGVPEYEILGYGPERLGGVPDEEKYNLPWATETARAIADEWNKRLIISYSTEQLHLEAEERGFGWDNPGAVVELLAPYGDLWLIQAADEYNDPYYNPEHPGPILSQRHFAPGPEWRAEVEKWVTWIQDANPDIEIWIQLALHRIPAGAPPWEDDYPSAELALEYREWLVNPELGPPLVDGVFLSSVYSWPIDSVVADQQLELAFRTACSPVLAPRSGDAQLQDPPVSSEDAQLEDPPILPVRSGDTQPADAPAPLQADDISLVEEGWTDDLVVAGITVLPGYYYRLYENSRYPCGAEGNHQFMVLDSSPDPAVEKHLFVKFLGGAVGFWYLDAGGNRVYYPQENAVGLLNEELNRNWVFRTSVSEEYADGVTRKLRENGQFRILVPSYCSHDFYHGTGQCDATDGFCRTGYLAAMEAVDHVQANMATGKLIVYGGSAGAAGFYVGKDQDNVAGIIMDSQAVDMSAISDACYAGHDAFGGNFPCFCPAGGPSCMEVLAPRIGFDLGQDEPYHFVERGEVDTPIFLIWNAHDASSDAHYQYDNLHQALREYNPGGHSVACRVCLPHADPEVPDSCIPDDDYEPLGTCNLHVPTAYDEDFTAVLVQEVYGWALERVGEAAPGTPGRMYLPIIVRERPVWPNVVVVGWDGVQRDHLMQCYNRELPECPNGLPNLQQLSGGAIYGSTTTSGGTATKPGWAQLVSGYNAEVTGIYDLERYQPLPGGYSIFEKVENHIGPDNVVTMFVSAKGVHTGGACIGEPTLDDGVPTLEDKGQPYCITKNYLDYFELDLVKNPDIGNRALALLEAHQDDLFLALFLWRDPDVTGHMLGENSSEYTSQLVELDGWLGQVVDKLQQLGIYDSTLVYVVTDHGFDEGDSRHMNAPYGFLASNDPGITRNGDRKDLAPTILERYGITTGAIGGAPAVNGHSLLAFPRLGCIPEGEAYIDYPGAPTCCGGLSLVSLDLKVGVCVPATGGTGDASGYCTACGDGVCLAPESLCNCPQDCG